jgi:hypothetical protein
MVQMPGETAVTRAVPTPLMGDWVWVTVARAGLDVCQVTVWLTAVGGERVTVRVWVEWWIIWKFLGET